MAGAAPATALAFALAMMLVRHEPGSDHALDFSSVGGRQHTDDVEREDGRYTTGHFDIPVMKTTIRLDNRPVVVDGRVMDLA